MTETLFLAHRVPYPPDRGDKMRSWHLLRHLAERGRVHLACFADDAADARHIMGIREQLGPSLGEVHVELRKGRIARAARGLATGLPMSTALFSSATMTSFVDRLLRNRPVGAIFAFSGQMAQYVPDPAPCPFIMDFVDVDSAKFGDYAAQAGPPHSWLYRREAKLLLAYERDVALRADVSLFVSGAEASLFRSRTGLPGADIRALGNGIDLDFYDPAADFPRLSDAERGEGPAIVFTGQMDYRPNIEAVTAFAHDVMPLIRNHRPNARFVIVGRNPGAKVRSLAGLGGCLVTGAVADVRSWLAAADVVVAPLMIARGVQNKVLEAMAMGRPTIVSPAAFEGIEAEPGRDLLVAAGADAQAEAVLSLLDDSARSHAVGSAGRRRVEGSYAWKSRLAALDDILAFPVRAAA